MACNKDIGLRCGGKGEGEEEERSSQWSQLPSDLVGVISSKIGEVSDYVRFRAVCPSWRLATRPAPRIPSQLPWLMLPPSNLDPENHRSFFSLADEKVYRLHLPEACCCVEESSKEKMKTTIICGTQYGWLVMADYTNSVLSLLNPLTRAHIHLPPLADLPLAEIQSVFSPLETDGERFKPQDILHVFLSSDPADGCECVVAVAFDYSTDIAFCRLGDSAWTLLDTTLRFGASSVAYRDGRFYVADDCGRSVMIDTTCNPLKPKTMPIRPPQSVRFTTTLGFDLLNSAEKLLLVASWSKEQSIPVSSLRHTIKDIYSSEDDDFIWDYRNKNRENENDAFIVSHFVKEKFSISIFELSSSIDELQWCEVSVLSDAALFFTKNRFTSVIYARFNSRSLNKKKGCIYFNFHDKTHYSYSREKITLFVHPINQERYGHNTLVPLYPKEDFVDEIISETVHCIDILDIGDKTCQLLPCQREISTHPSQSLWITPSLHDASCQPSSNPVRLADMAHTRRHGAPSQPATQVCGQGMPHSYTTQGGQHVRASA